MASKILEIEVTMLYRIEVDSNGYIVKEYENEKQLVDDLVSYRFTTLPVINNGVIIQDIEALDWSYSTIAQS